MARQSSSEAVTSPPGESNPHHHARRMSASLPTRSSSLRKPKEVISYA